MKKNRMMRLGAILLVCVLMTTAVISGTFAKYTSSATVTDSAKVAKWSVLVGTEDIAGNTTKTLNIDLFSTVLGTEDGEEEQDILNNNGSLIAPGTKGSFDIVLTNSSEVNATYDLTFTLDNDDNIPIVFTGMTNEDDTAIGMGDTKTITVNWEWAFDGDDTIDTTKGKEEPVVSLTVDVTFNQVN